MQDGFQYSREILDCLDESLSLDRLSTYSQLANGDGEKAIKLYLRNIELSAALYGPIQTLEIVIRNAIHRKLSALHGAAWYDSPDFQLEHPQDIKIRETKSTLALYGKDLIPPQIVASLSFGFWVGLLGNKYENFWRSYLYSTFSHLPRPSQRKEIHGVLNKIKRLRNRIAHHEPVLTRKIAEDYALILKAIGWVCPETANWVDYHFSSSCLSR